MTNVFFRSIIYQELLTTILSQRAADIRKKIVQNVMSAKSRWLC